MRLMRAVLLLLAVFTTMGFIVIPAFSGPPYYHEEGNVNYPGSYFESTYISRGIGVDDSVTLVDGALIMRAWYTTPAWPWGIGFGEYNPDADIDGDGRVYGSDLNAFGSHFGLNYNATTPFEYEDNPSTKVKIDPATVATKVDDVFVIDIKIKNVEGLNMWEAKIWWSQQLLTLIDFVEGDFLKSAGNTNFLYIAGSYYLYIGATGTSPTVSASGDGTLATVTFKCNATGTTPINLSSRLFDVDLYSMRHRDYSGESNQSP